MVENDQSKRTLLKGGLALGALASSAALPFWSRLARAAEEELIPFSDMPPNFTAPPVAPGAIHYLDSRLIDTFYTPNDDFYLVQHYDQPVLDPASYRLRVTGLVDNPLELSLDELRQLPPVEIDAGFECGGNSNNLFHGLIGNARWKGARLADVLQGAGLQDAGREVVFYGADKGMETIRDRQVEQAFGRSMQVEDARRPEVLLAYEMNGEPLPHYHGAPLRLLVPGWYGVANVKWLSDIHVQDRRYMGRFMARDYVTLSRREVGGVERWDERSVTRMQLKSSIVRLTRSGDRLTALGFVLNDGTPLRSIEISLDGGPWQPAEVDPQSSQYSWKLFTQHWEGLAPGEHSIVSRVTDVNGQVQPTPEEMPEKVTRWENNAQFTRGFTL